MKANRKAEDHHKQGEPPHAQLSNTQDQVPEVPLPHTGRTFGQAHTPTPHRDKITWLTGPPSITAPSTVSHHHQGIQSWALRLLNGVSRASKIKALRQGKHEDISSLDTALRGAEHP